MKEPTLRLLFFAGSTRDGSFNKKLAALGHHIAEANGIEAVLVDLKDYPMPIYNGDLEAKEVLLELRILGERRRGERLGELARVALQPLRELQRDRAGEVAVLGLARFLERDLEAGMLGRFLGERLSIGVGETFFGIRSH